MKKKFWALLLRGSSMGAKFLLLLGVSKILTVEDYGTLSLIVTTITFLMFVIGLDFYNYSHREVIEKDLLKKKYIVSQFWFHAIAYIIVLPITYLLLSNGIIPLEYIFPFYILLVLEHFSQEAFRFLNLFNKPNVANISLFIRTALWIAVLFSVEYFLKSNEITIQLILYYWIAGSLLSLFFVAGYVFFVHKSSTYDIQWFVVDKPWIKQGLLVSLPFFAGTIAYKIVEYSDRFMIDWYLGKEAVGIYSFYTNFANILTIVVNTITVTLIVPDLLRSVNSGNKVQDNIRKFSKELQLTTLIISSIILVLIFPTLNWLDKKEFNDESTIYFIILLGNIALNLSLTYHFLLYAYKKDKLILWPAIIAALSNIILNMIFIPIFGIIAAAVATFCSFSILFIMKRKYWLTFKNTSF